MRDPLKVVHEDDVDGRAAHRADDRQRAGGDFIRHHQAEARRDFARVKTMLRAQELKKA